MSGIVQVGGKTLASHNTGTDVISWGTGVPAGTVLQVSTQFFGEAFTQDMVGGTPEAINGGVTRNSTADWNVLITPSAASAGLSTNFICTFCFGRMAAHNTSTGHGLGLTLERTTATVSTDIGISTHGSNLPKCTWFAGTNHHTYRTGLSLSFVDTVVVPSTPVAIMYKVKGHAHAGGTYTTCWNRGPAVGTDADEGYLAVTGSTWTVTEVVG